ncbi:Valine--tRNA ligase [Buchnera aphidicola (Panaphis juglandis)]
MEKKYNPNKIEEKLYHFWCKNGYFTPNHRSCRESFSIIMPPPNITGSLHMGHAFQNTIMDILIRYHRMQGKNTLWQMGTDHAGIATQIIVLKKMRSKNNYDVSTIKKDFFIKKCWEWKNQIQNNIIYQIKRLGSSVDWTRTRFTLDEISSKGVKKAFIKLYDDGFIYRKKKLSHWDIKLQTVVSDLEVEYHTKIGKMWHIKYFFLKNDNTFNKKKYLIVSTTRPETLLGDVAVAIHPDDDRYKSFIGCRVYVPLVNRCIPVIQDEFVDMKKGTGCVKITPAHDFNDYKSAIKHKLPLINIFDLNGNVVSICSIYDIDGNILKTNNINIPNELRGLHFLKARKRIVSLLKQFDYLNHISKETITVSYGDRSGEIIEPMLTDQWYLRTSKISENAIQAIIKKRIIFLPQQYKNMYLSWMNNIEDWCISRQLWWGHKIPAWYDDLGNIYVGYNEEEIRKKYSISKNIFIFQDSDVLDTWFSSSLWTFLSLDWPQKKNLLNSFHPTTILVSGFDIIFFWIARMIMMTMHFIKDENGNPQIPFKKIYITGLIKDESGQKMSKSKGNVLDPLDLIDGTSLSCLLHKRKLLNLKDNLQNEINERTKKMFPKGIQAFGADALRFTCASLSSMQRSINWDMNRLQGYRNFCSKIWNAGNFILINTQNIDMKFIIHNKKDFFFNIWIYQELNCTIKKYRRALNDYRFDLASKILYDFFWNKFCDWYLEIAKIIMNTQLVHEIQNTKYTLLYIFEIFLRLAHPIIPFITEHIWKKIKNFLNIKDQTIMLQEFPEFNNSLVSYNVLKIMVFLQKMISFLRKIRILLNIKYNILLSVLIFTTDMEYKNFILSYIKLIKKIGYIKEIIFSNTHDIFPKNSIMEIIDNNKVFVIINFKFDIFLKIKDIKKKINNFDKKIYSINQILSNIDFLKKADKSIINKKRNYLKTLLVEKENCFQQILFFKNFNKNHQ